MNTYKDIIVIIFCCYIPILLSHTKPRLYIIDGICILIIILAILPYIITKKCIIEVIWSRHPIRNIIVMYRKYPIVYYITMILIGLTVLNYLLSFKIL